MNEKDYVKLMDLIINKIDESKYDIIELGKIAEQSMYLFKPRVLSYDKKRILVVSGFHGEEVGGPWGLCKFITDGLLDKCDANVSFIPVINPDGFSRGTRYNRWGEISNRFFDDHQESESKEALILLKNINLLVSLANDGFLTMHENKQQKKFYFYLYANKITYNLNENLKKIGKKHFGILEDGHYKTEFEEEYTVRDGFTYMIIDSSFESFMYESGIPICVTTETPIEDNNLRQRIETNKELMKSFIDSVSNDPYGTKKLSSDWVDNFMKG
jgi:hypothetical protein